MSELIGKRALVTGASRGIGAGIALALAEKGADVAITYERSADRAAAIVRAIEAKGRRAVAIQADSADSAAVKRSVAEAVEALGGLDILVNNAGIARIGPFVDMRLEDIEAILAVNIRAVLLASQAAIAHFDKGGRIITVGSSMAERVPFASLTAYATSKAALLGFTRSLAREIGPAGHTANLVQPGPIDTDLNRADGPLSAVNIPLTALHRYGTTAELAAVVAFLASPAASYVTGSVVTADGGFNA